MKKICSKCKIQKKSEHFWKNQNRCIICLKLKNKFNLTLEDYNKMLTKQARVCKICKDTCKTGRNLAVDHGHTTNKIRGLLCSRCNSLLGQARDNIKILKQAIIYLEANNDKI